MSSADHSHYGPAAAGHPHRARRKMTMRTGLRIGAAAVASGALAATAALTMLAPADASVQGNTASTGYHFRTLDNANDLTFNQLLGINNEGVIAGYFGSGAQGHANKGYRLYPPYRQGNFVNENFPGSVQTQVTGLNDLGVTVGFWSSQNTASMMNNNFGFYAVHGSHFHSVNFPTTSNASPQVDQLLGVNDRDVAVGFYTNAQGSNRGYEYNIDTHRFSRVLKPGAPHGTAAPSLTAAAINNLGDVAGFYVTTGGVTKGFLETADGSFTRLAFPGASMTQAFGVNDFDKVVGTYTLGTGSTATTHGFTWKPGHGFTTVDDPNGVGTTIINGVNDLGSLVGFYTDAQGNTDGMLAQPGR
jgi:hypothetical protein